MKTERIIDELLRAKRPNTARCYEQALRQFREILGKRAIQSAKAHDAMRFLSTLKSRGLADKTIHSRIDAMSSIFTYLQAVEEVNRNPFKAVLLAFPRRQQEQVRPTERIETHTLIETLDSLPLDREGIRDRGILSVMFGGGLRRTEARLLRVGDVRIGADIKSLSLSHTKSGKYAEQPLPDWAWGHLSAVVAQRSRDGAEAKDPLFVLYYAGSNAWRAISDRTFLRLYRKHIGAACHSARATFATRLLEQGNAYEEVARAMRHSSLSMVEVYDHRMRQLRDNCAVKISFEIANDDEIVVDATRREEYS